MVVQEIWNDAEDVHGRSSEVYNDFGRGLSGDMGCIMPGIVVYIAKIQGGRCDVATVADFRGGPNTPCAVRG